LYCELLILHFHWTLVTFFSHYGRASQSSDTYSLSYLFRDLIWIKLFDHRLIISYYSHGRCTANYIFCIFAQGYSRYGSYVSDIEKLFKNCILPKDVYGTHLGIFKSIYIIKPVRQMTNEKTWLHWIQQYFVIFILV